MEVVLQISGPTQRTFKAIETNAENARQAIRQTFFRMGKDLKSKTSKDILDKSSKAGRYYWVYRDKHGRRLAHRRRHRASAPGQTHANLHGKLRESLGWKTIGTNKMEFGYGLTRVAPPYASRIEEGGTDIRGVHIAARPSLKNNVKNVKFEEYFHEALRDLEVI